MTCILSRNVKERTTELSLGWHHLWGVTVRRSLKRMLICMKIKIHTRIRYCIVANLLLGIKIGLQSFLSHLVNWKYNFPHYCRDIVHRGLYLSRKPHFQLIKFLAILIFSCPAFIYICEFLVEKLKSCNFWLIYCWKGQNGTYLGLF